MKFVWEESDIKPGTIVRKKGSQKGWLIVSMQTDSGTRYGLAQMSDGSIIRFTTREALAKVLTEHSMIHPNHHERVAAKWKAPVRSQLQKKVLTYLRSRMGESLSTNDIIDHVYGDRVDGGPDTAADTVRVAIYRLRKKGANIVQGQDGGYMIPKPTVTLVA